MIRAAAAVLGMFGLLSAAATYGIPFALYAIVESMRLKEERLKKERAKAEKESDRATNNKEKAS